MLRSFLATVVLILAVSPASAKLGVNKIEACYGRLGPVRKTLDFYIYDEAVFRFIVTGAKAKDGTVDVSCDWRLVDDKGKVVMSDKLPGKVSLAFGIDSLPYSVGFFLPLTESPGDFVLHVKLKDNVSAEETGFEKKLKMKTTEFAIVTPRFYYDEKFTVLAPCGGVVGQKIHYGMWAIGFDRANGVAVIDVTVDILDEAKRDVQTKPLRFSVEEDKEGRAKKSLTMGFSAWMVLTK